MKHLTIAAAAAGLAFSAPAAAQELPFTPGTYWEVSMVDIEDGRDPDYIDYLARQWRANQEFARSKGWIRAYHVLSNEYPRDGEPDLYLVVELDRLANPNEEEQRRKDFEAFTRRTQRQMAAESGDRAKIRTLKGSMLLRELNLTAR